ncbi:MAG TPA: hypothetical protein PLO43_00280, partial [Chlamydiales bacterium]|nr:hypothetical protein [Chlamydiales bacterium]
MIFLYNYKIESIVEKIEQAEKDGQLGSYQVSVINGHLVDFEGTQLTVSEVSQLFSELAHHQYSNSNAFDQFFTKITNVVDQEKVKTQNPIWKQLAQSLQSYHNDFKEIAAELAFLRQLTDELKAFDVHQPLLDELKVFFVRSSVDLKKIREVQAQVLEELIKCEGQPVSKYAAQLAQVMLKSCAANEPIILDRGNYLHLAARSGNVEVAKEAIWQAGDRFAADVSAYNKVGAPPLMIALGLGHYEVAQL